MKEERCMSNCRTSIKLAASRKRVRFLLIEDHVSLSSKHTCMLMCAFTPVDSPLSISCNDCEFTLACICHNNPWLVECVNLFYGVNIYYIYTIV